MIKIFLFYFFLLIYCKLTVFKVADVKKRLDDIVTKEAPNEPKPMGSMKMTDVHPYITAEQK